MFANKNEITSVFRKERAGLFVLLYHNEKKLKLGYEHRHLLKLVV